LREEAIAFFISWRLEFDPSTDHVGFVVDKVSVEQVFLPVLPFSPVSTITPTLHTPPVSTIPPTLHTPPVSTITPTLCTTTLLLLAAWQHNTQNHTQHHTQNHTQNHNTPAHSPRNQHYMIYHQIDLYFHVTETAKSSLMMADYCRNM
jgi:hypothetical protein